MALPSSDISKLELAKQCIQGIIPKLRYHKDGFGFVVFNQSSVVKLPLQM